MEILDYLKETSRYLNSIIDKSEKTFEITKDIFFDELLLTGSGTSLNAAIQVKNYMQDILDREVIPVNDFDTSSRTSLNKNTRFLIGISQGGGSYSTYNAMKIAKSNNLLLGSMTGNKDSIIDEIADFNFPLNCGEEEAGAKTKGYYASKLNLMLFSLYYALHHGIISSEKFEIEISRIRSSVENFDNNLNNSIEWVIKNKDLFKEMSDIKLVSSYEHYGDTLESALKLLETMRIPVSGFEFEQFVHGIYNSTNEKTTIFLLDDGIENRMSLLKDVLSQWTEKIFVISPSEENADFILETGMDDLLTFALPIPIQVICSVVPALIGIDPSVPLDPEFHSKVRSKKR